MTLLRGRVEVEESRSVVHPEFGPEAATIDAPNVARGRFVCFCRGVIIVNRTDNHLPPTHTHPPILSPEYTQSSSTKAKQESEPSLQSTQVMGPANDPQS